MKIHLLLFFSVSLLCVSAWADDAPLSVAQYSNNLSLPNIDLAPNDMTSEDVIAYLKSKHELDGLSQDASRILNLNPTTLAGKIVIRVHKSNDPNVPEYLEVFQQNSSDPTDLTPQYLFDGGNSNTALVSTAGSFGGVQYTTPSGNFSVDSLEAMHYSHEYDNAPMPWSAFFNGGIAIHGAVPSEYPYLGRVASHGCVRTHPTNAELIFNLITGVGKPNAVIEVLDN